MRRDGRRARAGVLALAVTTALAAAAAGPAGAATAGPLGLADCRPVEGVVACAGLVPSWDGVPLDVTVVLPSGAAPARPRPLVAELNGFGNSKSEYLGRVADAYTDTAYGWARAGYAVLTYTARGFWGSCGTPEARLARPDGCARGWIHLADTRYEVRDAQHLIGLLVDEGVADPARIGVTGDSYGGGQSLALAALRDRTMLPDGRLVPWRTPAGTSLRLAAAAPVIPWSDLIGAIAPNGRTRATAVTPAGDVERPVGVFKISVANAIMAASTVATGPGQPLGEPFVPGRPMGFLAPPGVDPAADVAGWVARADVGEPYTEPYVRDVIAQMRRYRSAYGIDASVAPPPLLVAAGLSDDLFPADEALRFVNRLRRDHPRVPVSVLLGDFGHQRAANRPADRADLVAAIHAWFARYVRGDGAAPAAGVRVTTQACPRTRAPEGPFTGRSLAAMADGEATVQVPGRQDVVTGGGDATTALRIDPVAGGGDGCVTVEDRRAPGTATARLAPAGPGGLLLLGAPVVTARLAIDGEPTTTQLAARLWDADPRTGTRRLVARALFRPDGQGAARFELHPNAWRFDEGHVPALELLAADAPYGRPSNAAFRIRVTELALRLPTRAAPPAAARACVSRRLLTVRVPTGLREVRATLAGRRLRVRRGRVVVDLRGRARGAYVLRITGRTRAGARASVVRRYRTCVAA